DGFALFSRASSFACSFIGDASRTLCISRGRVPLPISRAFMPYPSLCGGPPCPGRRSPFEPLPSRANASPRRTSPDLARPRRFQIPAIQAQQHPPGAVINEHRNVLRLGVAGHPPALLQRLGLLLLVHVVVAAAADRQQVAHPV